MREESIYKLRKERGKGTKTSGKTRVGQHLKMLAKEIFEAVRDGMARSGNIGIDSLTVSQPQSVESHRMTSLEPMSVSATKESGAASRPGKEGLMKGDGLRKVENMTKIRPNLSGERTVVEEMTKGLSGRAMMTEELFGSKMKDTLTKGKSIHDELVPGLPVTRKE